MDEDRIDVFHLFSLFKCMCIAICVCVLYVCTKREREGERETQKERGESPVIHLTYCLAGAYKDSSEGLKEANTLICTVPCAP